MRGDNERVTLRVVHGYRCKPDLVLAGPAVDLSVGTLVKVAQRSKHCRERVCVVTAEGVPGSCCKNGQVSAWGEDGYHFGPVEV